MLDDRRVIGRIFRPVAGVPEDRIWKWTITAVGMAPRLPSHGFAATTDEAKTAFAEDLAPMAGASWKAEEHRPTLIEAGLA